MSYRQRRGQLMAAGRGSTGGWVYRTNRAAVLAASDICALCGHPGARTADHIITAKDWPRGPDGRMLPGFNDPANLQPAHGTMGPHASNPCPVCGLLCNQVRGARHAAPSPRSRDW